MQTIPPSGRAISRVLAHKPFRHLWFGQICSQLASNMMLFTLALMVYQSTGSNAAVSALFLAFGVPSVLFGLLAGVIVDHFDKRFVLILCDISRGLLVLSLFFVLNNPFIVYGLVFIHAVITQFYVPAEAPTIPTLVPQEHIVTANSLFSFTYYSSMAIGFIIAGPMLRFAGSTATFWTISALFVVAAFFVSRLPKQGGNHSFAFILQKDLGKVAIRVFSDLQDGIRYATNSRVLFDALLLLTGTQVILATLGALGPGFADRVLGIDVRDVSLIISAPVVLGIVVGALWVGAKGYRYRSGVLIQTGIVSAGIILILISVLVWASRLLSASWFFQSSALYATIFVLFILLGIANSLLDVPANSILQGQAQGNMRSRIYGMLTASVGGVGMLPVVAGGVLADVIGVGKVIFGLGAIIVVYGIVRVRYNRNQA